MSTASMLERLKGNLPDAYAKDATSNNHFWLSALAVALSTAETEVVDFLNDLFSSSADGEGATRLALTYGIHRPPGLSDGQLMILVQTMVGCRRGTLAAIKSVLEAATGLSGIEAYDKQRPGSFVTIPPNEIWITIPADTYGCGFYWGYDTHYSGDPVESGVWGVIHDAQDEYGGRHNDHWWGDVDIWSQELVDSVRLAGTVIIYKPIP